MEHCDLNLKKILALFSIQFLLNYESISGKFGSIQLF